MSPAVDPMVRLALALSSSRGAFAALLGSGLSAAAGVPTGRQIVADLVRKLAALEGSAAGEDPLAWYRNRFGEEPDYSQLLDAVARSPTERSALLRGYFEPSDEQRRKGMRVPGPAHLALARLAAEGYLSVFLTTNFDRLLEQALDLAGVSPIILSTPDALEGTLPLGRGRCTLIKLNGDYLDTRIKNTPAELDAYHPAIERLLDRVLDEYGLIVCGWSADWDTALRRAFERCPTHRYTTFWTSRNPPTGAAARLIELRGAELVPIRDADSLFTELAAKLAVLERAGGGPATGPVAAPAAGLPARAASFVGRRRELGELRERLADPSVRLLTLLGPGGAGKTALAIEAAAAARPDFADGVAFVDLSGARDTDAVLVAISRSFGLGELTDRPMQQVLAEHLRPRQLLLVLDNFEQVAEAAGLVAELLAECAGLRMLVTSRAILRLRGEQVYPVPPLALPAARPGHAAAADIAGSEAVQLFLDRARAVRPDFELTDDNAPMIAEICRRLDGLPLAIELAAARLRLLSPQLLLDQLGDRLKLLRGGPRDLPERQQALRATIDWSYELLGSEEQRLFELLSVFADADIGAVEAVAAQLGAEAGIAADVVDGLTSLLEKSLIRRVDLPGGPSRLEMLGTIREFATDRLLQRPDLARRAREAHARHYAEMVRGLAPELAGSKRLEALAALLAEVGNLRIAWRHWVEAEDAAELEKLADGLLILNEARGWYLDTVGLTTDLLSVLSRTGASPDRLDQEMALRTSLTRALMITRGYTPEVEEAFARSFELFERGGERLKQFSALKGLARLLSFRGEPRTAQIGQEVLAFAERENDPAMQIEGHLLVGTHSMFIDDLEGGLVHLDAAIALFAAVPLHAFGSRDGGADPRVACYTTSAITLWLLGYPDRAVERVDAALELAARLEHPFTSAFARFHSGLVHLWRRDYDTVLERSASLLETAEEHGFEIWKATGGVLRGAAEVGRGEAEAGLAHLRAGMELYQGLRSPPVFWPMVLWIHAAACHRAGRPAEGLPAAEAALEMMSQGPGTVLLSELQLTEGDLLLGLANREGRTDCPEAERWYRLGFERAHRLGARISELRAATRLCRIAPAGGPEAAARRVLAEIQATFTEGFDCRDLEEAREILDAGRRGLQPPDCGPFPL